jgi:hypothetical protein
VTLAHQDNSQETVDWLKTTDVPYTTKLVMPMDKFNLDKPSASNAKLAQPEESSLETHVSFQLLAHATKHVMLLQTHALTAQLVNLVLEMEVVKHSTNNVTQMVKDNLDKLNATNVYLAKPDMFSKATPVLYQDQPVIATKSTTQWPTYVTLAQQDNSQETVDWLKITDVPYTTKLVMPMVKFNLDKLSASNVKLAQLVKLSSTTNASLQLLAHATKHVMLLPTHALAAQLVNSVLEMEVAKHSTNNVMPMVKFNLDKPSATNANHAQLVKLSSTTNVSLQLLAHATKHVMLLPTHVPTAQLVNLVLEMEVVKHSTNNVMPMVKDNLDKPNATNVYLAKPDIFSKATLVLYQDQPVNATKSTTQ